MCVSSLWWTDDLSRLNPAACSMSAGIGSSPLSNPAQDKRLQIIAGGILLLLLHFLSQQTQSQAKLPEKQSRALKYLSQQCKCALIPLNEINTMKERFSYMDSSSVRHCSYDLKTKDFFLWVLFSLNLIITSSIFWMKQKQFEIETCHQTQTADGVYQGSVTFLNSCYCNHQSEWRHTMTVWQSVQNKWSVSVQPLEWKQSKL